MKIIFFKNNYSSIKITFETSTAIALHISSVEISDKVLKDNATT